MGLCIYTLLVIQHVLGSSGHVFYVFLLQELKYWNEKVSVELINKRIGINEEASTIASLLTRMCLRSEVVDEGKTIQVEVPPTRAGKCIE